LWAYNIKTVLAEKLETILRRNLLNTRARDFYDTFILHTAKTYDVSLFKEAFAATVAHRGTMDQIAGIASILKLIESSTEIR